MKQRLVIVTGKGGVGKTLVSTALAAEWARRGERTLLVVQSATDVHHPLLDVLVRYAPGQASGFAVCRVDGQSALKEYVHRTVWVPGFYDWFLDGPALRHFAEAAPGFEELMCLGKLYDLVTDRSGGGYRRVVFDAPASGHAALMLKVPRVTAQAVRTGPLHHNAVKIQSMLEDDLTTTVLLVTLAEEMAVREALELAHRLRGESALRTGPVIANRLMPALFSDAEARALATMRDPSPALATLLGAAAARHEISTVQRRHLDTLRHAEPRFAEVPEIIAPAFDAQRLIDGVGRALAPWLDGSRHG